MYPAINPVMPRFFPQLSPKPLRLTGNDFSTPRTEVPQIQAVLSPLEKTPPPAREVLMATALASWGPVMAKSLIEDAKKKEVVDYPVDFSMAI